jgi:N-acyl-D-amino-acid deacylase
MKQRLALFALTSIALAMTPGGVWTRDTTAAAGTAQTIPVTGPPAPDLASFDHVITDLMKKWDVPGAGVAVMKDGRLILARGYGYADRQNREEVRPNSLFRLASCTKAFTAAAILTLVQAGRLNLEDKAFRLLGVQPPPGATVDRRIYDITIRNLLNHSGGWDRDKTFDPMFRSTEIAQARGVPAPANQMAIIRYMMGKPLQFRPGSQYSYSNFGYCVLGRIIEKVGGQNYESYVRSHVLQPAGVLCMRLGHTLLRERAPNEVRYYEFPGQGETQSVFPGVGRVPWPYGAWDIEAMDSHGGWIASAVDVLRFIRALDQGRIINKRLVNVMVSRPPAPLWAGQDTWYAFGWQVRNADGGQNWWHQGSLDGTSTIMVRAANGLTWAALYNTRPKNSDGFGGEMDSAMWTAVNQVKRWPGGDLFPEFVGCR